MNKLFICYECLVMTIFIVTSIKKKLISRWLKKNSIHTLTKIFLEHFNITNSRFTFSDGIVCSFRKFMFFLKELWPGCRIHQLVVVRVKVSNGTKLESVGLKYRVLSQVSWNFLRIYLLSCESVPVITGGYCHET